MANPLIPNLSSLKGYGGRTALSDGIAGTILAILLVPQAMAYAQLAGLPPQAGLYAALVPPVLYLLFGTSPFVSVGPVALISLVIAEAASGSDVEVVEAAAIVGIEAGIILAAIGALRLGRMVNFISEPVLLGFTAAVAILIFTSQLPTLIGTDPDRAGNLPDALSAIWAVLPEWNATTAAIGTTALAFLLLFNWLAAPALWKIGVRPPWRQAIAKSLPLLVVIGCAVAASLVGGGVARVSPPSGKLPSITMPPLDPQLWLQFAPSALAVAVVIFATATAVAKSLAGADRSRLDTSREAVALGLGNIGASLTGGYAVSASLSRSALVEDSGGKTPVAHVIGAALVLAVILFFAPILAYLPETALAALVISAVFGLIKPREMKKVWAHDRLEGVVIGVSFAATLLLGVMIGLAVGALAGLAHHLWISSLPRITRVDSNDGGRSFRSTERDEVELKTLPILILRIDRSLFFANAAFVEDAIFAMLDDHEEVTCLVLDMRAVNAVDASGAAMMQRLTQRLYERGVAIHFAAVHRPVQDRLSRLDSRKCQFHLTVADAMESCGAPQVGLIAPS
ncbi:sulfate permease [Erythrobacter sp. KY5]|uniref:SulP family inorganic anion transporter n=1 Tax=Erythrobacter sp. KY5 TaxID=2011159 RepID=UPI000DBEF9CB|nr:SulP family inorganic anion transporter [Erythrobacter sp. KY5]AWW72965.1 sulfate permease [Erythrobacter sp. KY5]